MRRLLALSSVYFLVLMSNQAFAEEAEKKESHAKATAELGYVNISGNSESETFLAKFEAEYDYKRWEHFLGLEALNASQDDQRSAEKYLASLQSDYTFAPHAYAFSNLDYEKDRFSGYEYQAYWAIGAGYKLIDTDSHTLRLEAGPGYRVSDPDPGKTKEELIGLVSEKYSWIISETSEFEQSLASEIGESNTRTRFKASLISQINSTLSMKLGYALTHNSDVGPNVEKTDRETTVTLVFRLLK